VGITRTRAQTHESGVLPYPLWVFFAGTYRVWVQLPSLAKTEWLSALLDVGLRESLRLLSALQWIHDL